MAGTTAGCLWGKGGGFFVTFFKIFSNGEKGGGGNYYDIPYYQARRLFHSPRSPPKLYARFFLIPNDFCYARGEKKKLNIAPIFFFFFSVLLLSFKLSLFKIKIKKRPPLSRYSTYIFIILSLYSLVALSLLSLPFCMI